MALGKGLQSLIPQQRRSVIHKETNDTGKTEDRIWHIPLSEITPNTEQPRKHFSHQELDDLVSSIKEHGILQPITVTEKMNGGYELIAGERRYRAAEILHLPTVPAIVRQIVDAKEKLALALIENIQRQDLNPIEEAFAYKRLMEEFHLTQEEVAKQVGKGRPTVANIIRLLDLPEPIQKSLMEGTFSIGKAKSVLSLKNPDEQIRLWQNMMNAGTTVRDVNVAVASHGAQSRKGFVRRDPNIRAQEEILEERLGSKVQITARGEKGTITISYYSKEEFKRIMEELA